MPSIEKTITIDIAPDVVFRAVTDVLRSPEWISAIVEVKDPSPDIPQVGSTFVEVASFMGKRFETEKIVTVYEPPHRFVHASTSGPITQSTAATLEPAGEGTVLKIYFEAEPGGFFGKLPINVLVVALEVIINGNLQKLKKMLEEKG
jgi:uncharacterized protein YndB with AHSA1/START domain